MVTRSQQNNRRRGAALLMSLLLIFMAGSLALSLVGSVTLELAEARNTIEAEQALYWANAGVHHACAMALQNPTWTGALQEGDLPPSAAPAGYGVTAELNPDGDLVVTSTGYAGQGRRTVEATVDL